MSDSHTSHEKWLSLLKDHLEKERYSPKTTLHWMGEATKFLTFIAKQKLTIAAVKPETVEHYVGLAKGRYRRRHGHPPNYEGWRCSHTNGIHMLLRLIHGQWPPVPLAVTPSEIFQREICDAYAQSLFELRGLATDTVSDRRAEASRFLEWLGQRASCEAVALLTVADVDNYMRSCRLTAATVTEEYRDPNPQLLTVAARHCEDPARSLYGCDCSDAVCLREHSLRASIRGREQNFGRGGPRQHA